MPSVPQSVIDLVERFAHNIDYHHSPRYNETQVRSQFIDPLFMALDWDMENRRGVDPLYQEVVHEATVRAHGEVRSPDYCFRVGKKRKFFVEAKKPAVDVRYDIHPAFQLRRYGWTAKLPLSILTDFEEFSVYDCRFRPQSTDTASKARMLYIAYQEYPDRWEEIASVFSHEAVWGGDYDRYAETTKGKRGTQEVDAAFLEEIESWRTLLARNLALRNPGLTRYELNFAVQRIIDRIIFLRICEDREIEPYEQLRNAARNSDVYTELQRLFRRADDRYNSGLFHFREEKGRKEVPDVLTPALTVDDKVLAEIIKGLYYPDSPYAFKVLGADILGNVYEQFLGSVIRLTPSHRAVVEQKPEVRKAGGVYYTPQHIVDYIVNHTVGRLCEGKPPGQIANLRILDPACGSGSFLLGAFQYLLDYHLNWYVEHPTKHARREVYQGIGGGWYLTTQEKKRILLNNIYGVDIDSQAVEVTKLALLLKVLEDESQESIAQQMAFWQERALPDLADNIKCGNSLIGLDYWQDKQMCVLDEQEIRRVNAFDWDTEFTQVMEAGGFDAVIGNPPWVFTRDVAFGKPAKKYFAEHFLAGRGKVNLYALFIERGIALLNQDGWFSMIVPNTFLRATTYTKLRRSIVGTHNLQHIVDVGPGVFAGVTASTIILVVGRKGPPPTITISQVTGAGSPVTTNTIEATTVLSNPGVVIAIYVDPQNQSLIRRMRSQCQPLASYVTHLISGIQTWKEHKSKFIASRRITHEYKPLLEGKDIGRYQLAFHDRYIWYNSQVLNVMQDEAIFLLPEKVLVQRVSGGRRPLKATLDRNQYYCFNSINTLVCHGIDNRYVLGILNSRLMNWFYTLTFTNRSELTVNIANKNLRQLPIPPVDLADVADRVRHDRMVELVESALDLHMRLNAAKTPHEKNLLKRRIEATDAEIDALVYELYGLTEDEIRVVEEATP